MRWCSKTCQCEGVHCLTELPVQLSGIPADWSTVLRRGDVLNHHAVY
jgi:hypothetical protein